ncbi:TonB-dependent receptor plug domain-containing protein [Rhodobacter sp. NSM]|uniref:TonB-dependent receptor plug domain-containing protein n=1 Tax=Rhodobacter sp. NSM TaxID=3457501 RepID=UPI003FD2E6C9
MKKTAASLLALMAAAPLQAQDIALDEIVVSPSLVATEASRTGASVDVVTAEDLQATGEILVSDVLARLPGVSYTRNGGLGTSTALRIRGLGPAYQTVRINGIDVADPSVTESSFDFGSLTAGGIARIEVLRGSQSAIYGSEAVAGVVDIATYRPTEPGTSGQVTLEAGSNRTFNGALSAGILGERGELAFTTARTVTDGISQAAAGTERDGFDTTFHALSGAYDLTEDLRIGAAFIARDSDLDIDGLVFDENFNSSLADTDDRAADRLRGGRVFVDFTLGQVRNEIAYAAADTRREYPGGFVELYEGERRALSYLGSVEMGALGLSLGAERTKESFESDTNSGDLTTDAIFAEARYALTPAIDLSFAARHDDPSDFDGKTTGRVALAWRLPDDLILRGVAGTGFRAPSLYQRFGPEGSDRLGPETSRSYELGLEKLLPNGGNLQATVFRTDITDRIAYIAGATFCASPWGCYDQLDGETRTKGVEISGRSPLGQGWEVFGSYTYTDAVDEENAVETRAIRVPRHDLVLGLEGQIADRTRGILTLQHVADVLDETYPDPAAPLDDWTVVNATVTYEVTDAAEAFLRVENLFDEEYQTVRGYAQPGRSIYAGLRARF